MGWEVHLLISCIWLAAILILIFKLEEKVDDLHEKADYMDKLITNTDILCEKNDQDNLLAKYYSKEMMDLLDENEKLKKEVKSSEIMKEEFFNWCIDMVDEIINDNKRLAQENLELKNKIFGEHDL